jgi:beta-phosphoglucomutase
MLDPHGMLGPAVSLAAGLGLILDLDGVVVDSMQVHELAWHEYLRRTGMGGYSSRMIGWRNEEIVRQFLGPGAKEEEILEHGARKEQLYREMMGPQLLERLVPGVVKFLARTGNVPVGLATNAEPKNVAFVLEGAGLRPHFQAIVDGSRVERPKPAPDVYRMAANELGLEPKNCIVFEDSVVGVAAARAAGTRVVGILTQGIPLQNIDLAVADFERPELEPWLAAQRPL